MRYAIKLYTTDANVVTGGNVLSCVTTVDPNPIVEVSRTVGPANYYKINKQSIAGKNVSFPREDIERKTIKSPEKIGDLLRPNSVLSVGYRCSQCERLVAVTQAIGSEMPKSAKGFFLSEATMSFGPLDIVNFTEDEEGDDDVELVGVAQFCFSLACDNLLGDPQVLRDNLGNIASFSALRSDLEQIVGPLKLFLAM